MQPDLTSALPLQANAVPKSNRRRVFSDASYCYAGQEEFGFAARAFSSAQEFLSCDYLDQTKCLILDVAMPEMSGLDLQEELKRRGQAIPIIFITGQKDEGILKQAFSQGAVKFLYKPFSDSALLDAVKAALDNGEPAGERRWRVDCETLWKTPSVLYVFYCIAAPYCFCNIWQ